MWYPLRLATATDAAKVQMKYIPIIANQSHSAILDQRLSSGNTIKEHTKIPGTRWRTAAGILCFWMTRTFQYPYCMYCLNTARRDPRGVYQLRMRADCQT